MYLPRPAWGFIFHLFSYLRLMKRCSESILFVIRGVPVSAVMWTETRACRKFKDAIHDFTRHIYSLLFHRVIQLFYSFSYLSVGINTCRHNMTKFLLLLFFLSLLLFLLRLLLPPLPPPPPPPPSSSSSSSSSPSSSSYFSSSSSSSSSSSFFFFFSSSSSSFFFFFFFSFFVFFFFLLLLRLLLPLLLLLLPLPPPPPPPPLSVLHPRTRRDLMNELPPLLFSLLINASVSSPNLFEILL